MWRYMILYIVLACGAVAFGFFDKIISKGTWVVDSVDRCPESDQYQDYKFIFRKKKLNRTHDGFDIEWDFPTSVNADDYGIYIEACKKVDGGCKLVQIFKDKSFCKYLMKHARTNFQRALAMMGLEDDCPLPKGLHQLVDFSFDPEEMPDDGMTGQFRAKTFLTRHDEKICCIIVDVSFIKKEIEDDDK